MDLWYILCDTMLSSEPCKVTLLHSGAWQAFIAQVPCLSKLRQSLLKGLAGEIIECTHVMQGYSST